VPQDGGAVLSKESASTVGQPRAERVEGLRPLQQRRGARRSGLLERRFEQRFPRDEAELVEILRDGVDEIILAEDAFPELLAALEQSCGPPSAHAGDAQGGASEGLRAIVKSELSGVPIRDGLSASRCVNLLYRWRT
jgi:hypothetical protein